MKRLKTNAALKLHEQIETVLGWIGALCLEKLKIKLPVTDQTSVIFWVTLFFPELKFSSERGREGRLIRLLSDTKNLDLGSTFGFGVDEVNSNLWVLLFYEYIEDCRAVDYINCSLVTPVSRQTQSDGYQCVYFDVARKLSKCMRHHIINYLKYFY